MPEPFDYPVIAAGFGIAFAGILFIVIDEFIRNCIRLWRNREKN